MIILQPKEAIRHMCKECLGLKVWDSKQVENCTGNDGFLHSCVLYPYRMGKRIPIKMFREECIQCQGGSQKGVRECATENCPLFIYRMGVNEVHRGKKKRKKALLSNDSASEIND